MPPSETYSLMDNDYVWVLTGIDYMFILVVGLVGNLRLSCMVSKRSVVNDMFYLAVANILLCLFTLPTYPVLLIMNRWPSCYFVCHLWPFLYFSLRFASLGTSTFISLLFQLRIPRVRTIVIVTTAWLVSFIISLPRGVFDHHEEIGYDNDNSRYDSCQSRWTFDSSRENQMTTDSCMLVVLWIFYAYSFFEMANQSPTMNTPFNVQWKAKNAMKITIRLIVIVALACGICWMPIALLRVVPFSSNANLTNFALLAIDVIAMSFMCSIPLCYIWLNGITIKQLLLPGQWFSDRSRQSDTVDTALTIQDVQDCSHQQC